MLFRCSKNGSWYLALGLWLCLVAKAIWCSPLQIEKVR
jgi:hypothetical protein